ncbi:hypothetical protein PPERSA_11517 [Pseudocohnilembus persalinus]|uniref:NAD(P)-binding domain-containing protein n=1 Tax=Pseudocohnilembus persalinus TaxID=266149 RepID=A0A0V0QY82_PSEPJ|nr:hypothetical protein PPERSA_11517 [Pseudocohnilembus persalinus]|eukprot:KRX06872.1 hypothetical protein PPERSA_11517 [Pseudocohnilembus persalinus]
MNTLKNLLHLSLFFILLLGFGQTQKENQQHFVQNQNQQEEDNCFKAEPSIKLQEENIVIPQKKLEAAIIGGSGAIGRLLVDQICESDNWQTLYVIGRRKLDSWDECINKGKLKLFIEKDLDILKQTEKWEILKNVDSFFCALGSRVKMGEDEFVKTDYWYPNYFADLAVKFGIPHYSLVSSIGANSSSWFLYMRTKGQVEETLKQKNLKGLSIFQPGVLLNRNNDFRIGEKIIAYVPFLSKIESKDLALALRLEAEQKIKEFKKMNNFENKIRVYDNQQILYLLGNKQNEEL